MKSRQILFLGAFLLVLSSAGMMGHPILAAAQGCFTDISGHWAEQYICWLKDAGISSGYGNGTFGPNDYVTRGQMAVFLRRITEVPPSSGQIQVSIGQGEWKNHYINNEALSFFYDESSVYVSNHGNGGGYYIVAVPAQPLIMYGISLNLTGFGLCYSAYPTAKITKINVIKTSQTNSAIANTTTLLEDPTERTDSQCIFYSIPTTLLDGNSFISIALETSWSGQDMIKLRRSVLAFEPAPLFDPIALIANSSFPQSSAP